MDRTRGNLFLTYSSIFIATSFRDSGRYFKNLYASLSPCVLREFKNVMLPALKNFYISKGGWEVEGCVPSPRTRLRAACLKEKCK